MKSFTQQDVLNKVAEMEFAENHPTKENYEALSAILSSGEPIGSQAPLTPEDEIIHQFFLAVMAERHRRRLTAKKVA